MSPQAMSIALEREGADVFIRRVKAELERQSGREAQRLEQLYALCEGLQTQDYLLNRHLLNRCDDINGHLADVNAQLEEGQYFIGCADHLRGYQTSVFRRGQLLSLRMLSFVVHRVIPKISYTAPFYRWFTRGQNKRMSRTEVLGRLAYAGFRIDHVREDGPILHFRVQKKSAPLQGYTPSFGPLIKMNRVVKGGKIARIYKFRTMHPYAEFIQDYVYEQNDLAKGGKLNADFRISEEGNLFRKYFLDELPMFINWLKGDIKLVGVRPLSEHYFSLYTEAMQIRRLRHKPGLLPPYYSEEKKPATLEEVMVNEMKYLIQHEKHPWKTDLIYLFRILNNIFFRKLRSQ